VLTLNIPSPLYKLPLSNKLGIRFYIKRDDLIHPDISGNKWRKLKYQLEFAKQHEYKGILTFGGAFSNHILATAAAASLSGLPSIGIIRGEASSSGNTTLKKAESFGMQMYFLSRSAYSQKQSSEEAQQLIAAHKDYLIIPEGGRHPLALAGVKEIVSELADIGVTSIDYLLCAIGTGTTFAGLSLCHEITQLIGIPVLKHSNIQSEIEELLGHTLLDSRTLNHDYHRGGYAKFDSEL